MTVYPIHLPQTIAAPRTGKNPTRPSFLTFSPPFSSLNESPRSHGGNRLCPKPGAMSIKTRPNNPQARTKTGGTQPEKSTTAARKARARRRGEYSSSLARDTKVKLKRDRLHRQPIPTQGDTNNTANKPNQAQHAKSQNSPVHPTTYP